MKPVFFVINGYEIYSYAIFNMLALLIGMTIFVIEAKRKNIDNKTIIIIMISCLLGSSLGSKLPIWIYYSRSIIENLPDIKLLFTGRTVVGGIIGGWIFVEIAKRVGKIKVSTGDLFAPAVAAGLVIGRIGCFLGGCCYGIESHLPWACDFGDRVMRHPTQIYSMIFDLGLFIYMVVIGRRPKREGFLFRRFLLLYFIFRFMIEFIRVTPKILFFLSGFQLTSIVVFVYLAVTYFMKKDGRMTQKNFQ